jgi:hypothetical protein
MNRIKGLEEEIEELKVNRIKGLEEEIEELKDEKKLSRYRRERENVIFAIQDLNEVYQLERSPSPLQVPARELLQRLRGTRNAAAHLVRKDDPEEMKKRRLLVVRSTGREVVL